MTDNALKAAVAQFLTEEGYSFDERDLAPDSYYSKRMARSISAYLSALPGEAEVVAWRGDDAGGGRKFTAMSRVSEIWADQGLIVTPLVTLTSYQAMQARAEAAERERDDIVQKYADVLDDFRRKTHRTEAAAARVKELEEALGPFAFTGLRDLSRFDEETGIEVHFPRTSPRKAIPVVRIYVEDVLRARTALKGDNHG